MNKIATKLRSLPKERLYMFVIGIIIVFGGFIGVFAPWFSALFGVIVGPFCILVGYYGADPKKGVEELKHDFEEVKDTAVTAAHKTMDVAELTAKSGVAMAQKATNATMAMGKTIEIPKNAAPVAPAKKPAAKK